MKLQTSVRTSHTCARCGHWDQGKLKFDYPDDLKPRLGQCALYATATVFRYGCARFEMTHDARQAAVAARLFGEAEDTEALDEEAPRIEGEPDMSR